MKTNLLNEVKDGLKAHKGRWRQIASAIDGVSYSYIVKVGSGRYESNSSYVRLEKIAEHLRVIGGVPPAPTSN